MWICCQICLTCGQMSSQSLLPVFFLLSYYFHFVFALFFPSSLPVNTFLRFFFAYFQPSTGTANPLLVLFPNRFYWRIPLFLNWSIPAFLLLQSTSLIWKYKMSNGFFPFASNQPFSNEIVYQFTISRQMSIESNELRLTSWILVRSVLERRRTICLHLKCYDTTLG